MKRDHKKTKKQKQKQKQKQKPKKTNKKRESNLKELLLKRRVGMYMNE